MERVPRDIRGEKSEYSRQVLEKNMISTPYRKCLIETSRNSIKVKFGIKVH